jgi:4-deoxy-L-threo-5-hexosulose-uronate ketol-isomerase
LFAFFDTEETHFQNNPTMKERDQMDIRHAVHPEHAKTFDTKALRKNFLIEQLFENDRVRLTYSHYDRLIVGGVCPESPLRLDIDPKIIGCETLLERRELGIINIGGNGSVSVDGQAFELDGSDGLYIGMGAADIEFTSHDRVNPAKFYLACSPAHTNHPTKKIALTTAEPVELGTPEQCNERTICKYIHPDGAQSCQLVMGMTALKLGSVWNTMPVHTHPRRIEAYLYFNMSKEDLVFHFMGEPSETRHLVVRNEQVVLSPSWSIHSGAGTAAYTFIWSMAGENQTFTDMDGVAMNDIR